MSWPQKKNCHFEVSSSLIPCKNSETYIDQIVTCNQKWILYNNWQQPTQWLEWEDAPKHFPKPNLHQSRSSSLFGGLLPIWSTTAFWIPVKPLHLRGLLSKLMRCTENCNACSRHWSTEKAQFSTTAPDDCMLHNQCFKSWMNWTARFCLSHHIHLTSRHWLLLLQESQQRFCRENGSTTSRRQKKLYKSSLNSKARIFMLQK